MAAITDFFCGRLVYIRRGDEEEDEEDPTILLPPLSPAPHPHPLPSLRQMTLTFVSPSCGGGGGDGREEERAPAPFARPKERNEHPWEVGEKAPAARADSEEDTEHENILFSTHRPPAAARRRSGKERTRQRPDLVNPHPRDVKIMVPARSRPSERLQSLYTCAVCIAPSFD